MNITIDHLASYHLDLFANIHPDTMATLIQKGRIEHYSPGNYIFRERDMLHCFYIILSGTVILYKNNANGQNKTIFVLGKNALLNEVIFDTLPSTISCKAHEDCVILTYYRDDLIQLMQNDFLLTKNITNALSNRIRRLYRQLKNATSTTKMEKKLAAKIWKFGRDYGVPCEEGILIDLNITITSLAELLGSYRETVSRSLKILIEKELISYEAKHIIIKDPPALAKFFKSP